MKKLLLYFTLLFCGFSLKAQMPPGSIAPDFICADINGNTWHLYDILDQGKPVILDISATWCGPCWQYHESGNLETLYNLYGPAGTNELMVLFIEGDSTTGIDQLHGIGPFTQGDWVTGTPYPIIDNSIVAHNFLINYYPTIYYICPNRQITEIGQITYPEIYANTSSCQLANGQNNAAVLNYQGPQGNFCEELIFYPAFYLQNMGTQPLQSASIDLLEDGVVKQTIPWSGNLNSYQTELLNFQQITVNQNVQLGIRVSNPNNTTDDQPSNDSLGASLNVAPLANNAILDLEIKFDDLPLAKYWEITDIDNTVLYYGGNPRAKNSNAKIIQEYTTLGVTVHHSIALPFNECYLLSFYDILGGGLCCNNGQGYYKLKDQAGNILAQGSDFGLLKLDPFGIQNADGVKFNADILSLTHLHDDFCDQYTFQPTIAVQNLGSNIITSLNINMEGDSGVYLNQTWTGSIIPKHQQTISLDPVTLMHTDNFKIEIVKVNNQPDTFLFRNSVVQKITKRVITKSSWVIDIIPDLHAWENYWQLTNDQGTIIASGGNTNVGINGGGLGIAHAGDPGAYQPYQHVQQTVNLPDGCYHFTVVDDKGDGMNIGSFGNPTPFARIRNPQVGIITNTNGDFENMFLSDIALNTTSALEEPVSIENAIMVYPNPASAELHVFVPVNESLISIYNLLGQRVWRGKTQFGETVIPVTNLHLGQYFISFQINGKYFVRGVEILH